MKVYRTTLRGFPHAFTLIELLIVVAIIAILAAIAVPNFLEAQTRAKVSRAKADIRALVTALETYKIDTNKYLSGQLSTDMSAPNVTGGIAAPRRIRRLTTPIAYMSSLPVAPFERFEGFSPVDERGFRYIGGDEWYQILKNPGNIPIWWPESYRYSHYIWFAVGPSKRYSAHARQATNSTPYQCPYEATNGTISIGDILYVSGNTGGWHSFK